MQPLLDGQDGLSLSLVHSGAVVVVQIKCKLESASNEGMGLFVQTV